VSICWIRPRLHLPQVDDEYDTSFRAADICRAQIPALPISETGPSTLTPRLFGMNSPVAS
jgi:hypothetical protein